MSGCIIVNWIIGSHVKGVIVMVGKKDFYNDMKRGKVVGTTAENSTSLRKSKAGEDENEEVLEWRTVEDWTMRRAKIRVK